MKESASDNKNASGVTNQPCSHGYTIEVITHIQRRSFSDAEIAEIIEKYKNGITTYELAKRYGCHRNTISGLLKRNGIDVTIEKIDMDEAIRLYEAGVTSREIAEKYCMTESAVSRRLKEAGVKMRTRWDYPKR